MAEQVLRVFGLTLWVAMPMVVFLQIILAAVAIKTAKRKGINPYWCWFSLVPYAGLITAYWIACAEEKKDKA